jgi:hypothetical protein
MLKSLLKQLENCAVIGNPRPVNEVSEHNFTGNLNIQTPNKNKSRTVVLSNSRWEVCIKIKDFPSDNFITDWMKTNHIS